MTKRVILTDETFLQRERLMLEPEVWEDGLRADTGPGTFEWWYFDALSQDGSSIVIVYSTKSLLQRTGPLRPTMYLSITRPNGQKLSDYSVYHDKQFSAAQDQCDVRIGPNWARGDLHSYELHAEGKGTATDLIFTRLVPPWRPGAGKFYYDEVQSCFFGWLPTIPFGYVAGTLTYDGHTHDFTGTGYHDHNWGNIGLSKVMSYWYWGRAHVGDYTVIFVEMVAAKAYNSQKIPLFMLAQGDRILIGDGQPLTLRLGEEEQHPSGKIYPRRLDLRWQTAEGIVNLALRRPQIIEASSILTYLPTWKRWLARLVANPYYFRFYADLELSVELAGTRTIEQGKALYELVILH